MAGRLNTSPQVYKLALDLGLKGDGDSVSQIFRYCEKRMKEFLHDYVDCDRISDLTDWVAQKLHTTFEVAHSDAELLAIKKKYLSRGERRFAQLEEDLPPDVFGITYRLNHRNDWEPEFVSVIDCRGSKAPREYFTKWHELAHLLVQTDQTRLSFKRSHDIVAKQDPEEALMDQIAGHFGFYPPIVWRHCSGDMSFETIEELRKKLCPKASIQASVIGFVHAWPEPCLLVHAEVDFRKHEKVQLAQGNFDFAVAPTPALRAVNVRSNDGARQLGMAIFKNMRVPKRSVIYRVHVEDIDYCEAAEDLGWWETSDGTRLPNRPILVKAQRTNGSVQALIAPRRQ